MRQNDTEMFKEIGNVKCPICNLKTVNLTCELHGKICESCGTLYKGEYCPSCFAPESLQTSKKTTGTFLLGEEKVPYSGFAEITGHSQLSKREINILYAANADEPSRTRIHKKAEAAIRWLNLPRSTEIGLLQTVEKRAFSIAAHLRSEGAEKTSHVSNEKVVAISLLLAAKKIGKTIVEVQEALARAEFNIKLQHFSLRIAVPDGSSVSSVNMYINGWKRDSRSFRPREAGEGPLGKEYTISVQTLLSDALDQKGRLLNQSCKVHFENAVVVIQEPAVIDHIFMPSTSSKSAEKTRILQSDSSTVYLKLDSKKCFSLFKSINRMLERSTEVKGYDVEADSDGVENTIRRHLLLPSKKFPASAALMRKAHCLDRLERRSVELFRESLENSNGRSRRNLARLALFQADKEIYTSLPEPIRQYMRGYVATLPLRRKDRKYAGVRGLLIPGEVLGVASR